MTYTSTYPLATQDQSWLRSLLLVLGSSILIALFAQVSIRLPFTPVPIGLQNYLSLFLGVILGPRRAALAVFLFLFQGAMGLPVFALGKFGLLHLLGPTGGYLVGYVLAAYVVGYLVEKSEHKTPQKAAVAMAVGSLVIFFCGASQLSIYLGLKSALLLGVLPFLAGDMIKLILAYQALKLFKAN